MDLKNFNSNITPTCIKETLEKKIKLAENKSKTLQDEPKPDEFIFASGDPYPQVVEVIPNRSDVRTLKSLTTGRNGELIAILTYLYQQYILEGDYPFIAQTLKQIAEVEMEHYELLSKAIVLFGGDPNLSDGIGNVWTGRNVSTIKNVTRILKEDIQKEQLAIDLYARAAKETNNASLAELYLRIAKDETLHIQILNKLLTLV